MDVHVNSHFPAEFWLGLQQYTGVPVHRNIFCHDMNIVCRTSYRDIYNTFTHASRNMGKHCLQLVLTLLPLFSPYAQRFSKQTDEKNPCWAVFNVIFMMADTTKACMLPTRLVSCTDFWAHKAVPFLFCCYVTYRTIVYHIVTTVSAYVSYCGKMYRCRPCFDQIKFIFWHWLFTGLV